MVGYVCATDGYDAYSTSRNLTSHDIEAEEGFFS